MCIKSNILIKEEIHVHVSDEKLLKKRQLIHVHVVKCLIWANICTNATCVSECIYNLYSCTTTDAFLIQYAKLK